MQWRAFPFATHRIASRRMKGTIRILGLFAAGMLAGCTSISSNYAGDARAVGRMRIDICHGFNCYFQTSYEVSPADHAEFARIMAEGVASPEAERQAMARAIMLFEKRATQKIGVP